MWDCLCERVGLVFFPSHIQHSCLLSLHLLPILRDKCPCWLLSRFSEVSFYFIYLSLLAFLCDVSDAPLASYRNSVLPLTSCIFDSFVVWLLNLLCFHGLLTWPWYVDCEFGTAVSDLMSRSFSLSLTTYFLHLTPTFCDDMSWANHVIFLALTLPYEFTIAMTNSLDKEIMITGAFRVLLLSSCRKSERGGMLCGSSTSHVSLSLPICELAVEVKEHGKIMCVVILP